MVALLNDRLNYPSPTLATIPEGGTMSAIFTTEPMINRALAAEIRHDPALFTALLEVTLDMDTGMLGEMMAVRCEGIGDIDVTLTYVNDQTLTTVGLESKFDHELTDAQVVKELAALADNGGGHLIFVLPEGTDAPQFPDICVLSWKDVLASFTESRLTATDIEGMPLTKRQVERHLAHVGFKDLLDDPGWIVILQRGGSGNPSIEFHSPALVTGREIRGQVQVTGRGVPKDKDDLRFEYHIGIQIKTDDEEDFPPDGGEVPPVWVNHLSTLRDKVITDKPLPNFAVSLRAAPVRSEKEKKKKPNPYLDSKIVVADRHLGGQRWLVKGYTNAPGWALGIKSLPYELDKLSDLCAAAAQILNDWLAVERADGPP